MTSKKVLVWPATSFLSSRESPPKTYMLCDKTCTFGQAAFPPPPRQQTHFIRMDPYIQIRYRERKCVTAPLTLQKHFLAQLVLQKSVCSAEEGRNEKGNPFIPRTFPACLSDSAPSPPPIKLVVLEKKSHILTHALKNTNIYLYFFSPFFCAHYTRYTALP